MSRVIRGLAVALVLSLVSSCGTEEGFTNVVIPSGFLRVVNFIPDSPQLNIFVNNGFRGRLNYRESTTFLEVLPQLSLRFTVEYVRDNQAIGVFTNEPLIVEINQDATVALVGTLDNPRLVSVFDPPVREVPEDEVEVRFLHAATTGDAVDIRMIAGGNVASQVNLGFAETSAPLRVAPDDYVIEVRDSQGTILWTSGNLSLAGGTRGLLAIADYFGPGTSTVRMVSVTDQGTITFPDESLPAAVRIANMIPDRGPVDVYANDTLLVENVPFGTVTSYVQFAPDTSRFVVRPFGDAATVILETEVAAVTRGTFNTLALTGLDDSYFGKFNADQVRRVPTRLLLTITNAAPSAGVVDFYIVDPGTSIDNLSPVLPTLGQIPDGLSSQTIAFRQGSFDFAFTRTTTKDLTYGPDRLDIVDGGIYSIFLTDSPGGGEPFQVIFADDF